MPMYCCKCKKKTNTTDGSVVGNRSVGKCADCGCKKSSFVSKVKGGAHGRHFANAVPNSHHLWDMQNNGDQEAQQQQILDQILHQQQHVIQAHMNPVAPENQEVHLMNILQFQDVEEQAPPDHIPNDPDLDPNLNPFAGEGIVDLINTIGDKISKNTLQKRPRAVTEWLSKTGSKRITGIRVCRTPLVNAFNKVLEILTKGQSKEWMKKQQFDRVYHLFLIFKLEDGQEWALEKRQRVDISQDVKRGDCRSITYNRGQTIAEFYANAEKKYSAERLYRYDGFKYNCQAFARDLLEANGINQLTDFIMQDVSGLGSDYLKKWVQFGTDLAGLTRYILEAGGVSGGEIGGGEIGGSGIVDMAKKTLREIKRDGLVTTTGKVLNKAQIEAGLTWDKVIELHLIALFQGRNVKSVIAEHVVRELGSKLKKKLSGGEFDLKSIM